MSSFSKREGAVGIAYQADPATAATASIFTVICEDCHIPGEPIPYERINNVTAESLGFENGGKDCTFSIDGIEPNAALIGYLLWIFGGGYSRSVGVHTISQIFDSKYMTVFKDQGGDFTGTTQVMTGVGCRIDSLTIDQQVKAFAKVSVSGMACDKGENAVDLTPSISLTADDAPLSWAALQAGDFNIGYNTPSPSSDDNITGVKLTLTRAHTYAGIKLASNQPDSITEGAREVLIEYTRDFAGDAAAKAEYGDWLAGTSYISLAWRWTMGSSYVDIVIPHVRMTADPMPSVGTGEEAQVMTVSGKAYMSATSNIMDIETTDGNDTTDFPDLT